MQKTEASQDLQTLADVLAEGYAKESELYGIILRLSELQKMNLEQSDDIRDFIMLLQEKDDLMRAIDKIELEVQDAKAHWLEAPEDAKAEYNGRLNDLLDGLIETIEAIMRVEQGNEELLKTRKEEVEEQLAVIRRGKRAAHAMKSIADSKYISAIS